MSHFDSVMIDLFAVIGAFACLRLCWQKAKAAWLVRRNHVKTQEKIRADLVALRTAWQKKPMEQH